jgi:mannose-6-phosphate isomerase-like protein (cupin superfamily)
MDEVEIKEVVKMEANVLPGGTQVKRFINREEDHASFIFGLAKIDPGADHGIFCTLENNDEAYYILEGKLTLKWDGKKTNAKKGDSVLFRAGRQYQVTNTGTGPAVILYVISSTVK